MKNNKFLNKENISFFIVLVIVTILYYLINDIPSIHSALVNFNKALVDNLIKYGIPGSFILSIIGNSSLIVQIPYFFAIILLGSQAPGYLYLVVLAVVSAVGMTIGEIISYFIGKGIFFIAEHGKDHKRFYRIREFMDKKPKLIPLLIFLFAATPLPDDVVIIPLGVVDYGYKRIIIPTLLGKIILASVFAFGGFFSYQWFFQHIRYGVFEGSIFLLILVLFAIFVYNKYTKNKKFIFSKRK
ncbi:VTT domain-containing protein [Candidatus Woesearchaeota archaeon]|nr:VTT domain-containing protein [Candidatus Woesearchaeota archaeon]